MSLVSPLLSLSRWWCSFTDPFLSWWRRTWGFFLENNTKLCKLLSLPEKKKKKVNDFLERKQALLGPCIPPKGKQTEQVCALHFLFNCTILFPLRTWIGGWKKQRVLQSCVCWVGALHCWGSALEASQTDQLQINLYPLQAYLAPAPHRLCSTLFSPNCFNLSIYFFQAVQLRMRFPWHSSVTASWWLCATRGHAVLCVCLKPF